MLIGAIQGVIVYGLYVLITKLFSKRGEPQVGSTEDS